MIRRTVKENLLQDSLAELYRANALIVAVVPDEIRMAHSGMAYEVTEFRIYYVPSDQR